MDITYDFNRRMCLTCSFWTGGRSARSGCFTGDSNVRGSCLCEESSCKWSSVLGSSECSCWEGFGRERAERVKKAQEVKRPATPAEKAIAVITGIFLCLWQLAIYHPYIAVIIAGLLVSIPVLYIKRKVCR